MPRRLFQRARASHASQYANAGMHNLSLFVIATPATRKNNVVVRATSSLARLFPFLLSQERTRTLYVSRATTIVCSVKDLAIPSSIHDFSLFPLGWIGPVKLRKLLMDNSWNCRGTLTLLSLELFRCIFLYWEKFHGKSHQTDIQVVYHSSFISRRWICL